MGQPLSTILFTNISGRLKKMSNDLELIIFKHELKRLEDDFRKCDLQDVREIIQQDIMLLRTVIEEHQ